MSKVKSSDIPHYELLYIISNKYSEDELSPIKEKITKLITDNGGNITLNDNWGKKRLAYPIKHFRHGYYHLLEFDLTGVNLKSVEDGLRLSEEILRYQIVRKEESKAEVKPRQKPTLDKESIITEESKPEESKTTDKPITATNPEASDTPSEPVKTEPVKDEEESKKKMEFQDLDDKLDKILDSDTFL